MSEGTAPQCEATSGEMRCDLVAGHGSTVDSHGDRYDHLTHVDQRPDVEPVHWSLPTVERVAIPDDERCLGIAARGDDSVPCALRAGHAAACVDSDGRPLLDELPKREPRCTATSPISGHRCKSPAGHARLADTVDGELFDHANPDSTTGANGGVWWNDDPAAQPDHDTLLRTFFDGVPGAPKLRMTALNPQPVRVRFVDLPDRREVRQVFGSIPANVVVPGGFALVVDRFGTAQRCADERDRWDAFGQAVGAATVLCYPGELEIVDYLSE